MRKPDRSRSHAAFRCTIYTRKSSDEGLEQEFNSLDAQREACEAYIVSQRHAGWVALPDLYDDGGLSGGSMGHPALQRLLDDVKARKVQIIVVYKVDRLTRSLADFVKIVDILDAHGASFVSVTQQFNTTTSMGRLTLNMLLSFAQFEREIAGERIRDKIAASKAKGMWMGGNVPLGYDVRARKLVVNAAEAETVRSIFRRYAELGSVALLRAELDRLGVISKRRAGAGGDLAGGKAFSRGALYLMLQNRLYRGEVAHKGNVYGAMLNLVVWAKTNPGQGSFYRSQHELIGVFRVGSEPHQNNVELGRHGRNRSNVWTYAGVNSFGAGRDEALAMHPTVKPVALAADALRDCSSRGDLVLDPFLGSGTTVIAAEKIGRRCFGLDYEPAFVDVAIRRWQAYAKLARGSAGDRKHHPPDPGERRGAAAERPPGGRRRGTEMTKPPNSLAEALSVREYHAILRRDLTSFIERGFYELQPGQSLLPAPYIEVVATKLEAVRRGEITRLIVNLPPRYLKSHCASVAFVAWLLGHDPTKQALCVSYGQELADELAGLCHRLMRSPFYRALFGDVLAGRRSVGDFETVVGGRRVATSVGGVLTGRGADVIILDDPQKAEDALSDTNRKAPHSWFDNTLLSRLNDKARGAIVIVTQRLHEDDLVAHVQRQGPWDVLSLPAVAESNECWLIEGPLGRRYFRRKPGDVLHPAREDAASLAQMRRAMSDLAFAAQYQQNPTSIEKMRAIQAERDRRQWDAYTSGDRLTLGRLWRSRNTGSPVADITDEQAIAAAQEYEDLVQRLQEEV